MIKKCDAVFISGKGLTHEYLIRAIAQQMGSAHEDDGLEPALVGLSQIFLNGVEPYKLLLAIDANLTLEIGERVLEKAEKERDFRRKSHNENYDDLSVVIRIGLKKRITNRILLLKLKSYISDVEIVCFADPHNLSFEIKKSGNTIKEIPAKYPDQWDLNTDAVFIFSYSSRYKQAYTITNGNNNDEGIELDIGWVYSKELGLTEVTQEKDFVYKQFVLTYERLFSPEDCLEILDLVPNEDGSWSSKDGQPFIMVNNTH